MKKSRSKYFEYIRDDLILSSVMSGAGVQALVPPDWENKKVKIIVNDSDFFYARAKRVKSRGFVPLPAYLAGTKVYIKLEDYLTDDEMLIPNSLKWLFNNSREYTD